MEFLLSTQYEQKQRESVSAKLAEAEKNEAAAKEALDYEAKQRETLEAQLSAAKQAEIAIKDALAKEQKQRAAIEQELAQIKSAQAQLDADHAVQLANEQKQREVLQEELAQIKSAHAQLEAERSAKQQQWLVKLKAALSDLGESDRRLAKEIETRCTLQKALQDLHQEFSSQS